MTDTPMSTTEATHNLMASMALLFLDVLDRVDAGEQLPAELTEWCRALIGNTIALTDQWRPE